MTLSNFVAAFRLILFKGLIPYNCGSCNTVVPTSRDPIQEKYIIFITWKKISSVRRILFLAENQSKSCQRLMSWILNLKRDKTFVTKCQIVQDILGKLFCTF